MRRRPVLLTAAGGCAVPRWPDSGHGAVSHAVVDVLGKVLANLGQLGGPPACRQRRMM
ncbi:hypothetical protein ACN27J_22505 [Solwaraspora sp. WMMB762]|uniref:hypothetical protein n=1 Tax=Solwaraspora sp. WMMB762 TaxID=3404120 RepID=UPI003B9489CD